MTLKGKIFMCLTFLFIGIGIGLVGGYQFAKSNEGNQINVTVDGKVKKDGNVNINLKGNEQKSSKKSKE
jgi:hypothetical protein